MLTEWELWMFDQMGWNGIREEHIQRVAEELRRPGLTEVSEAMFRDACYAANVDPDAFDAEALQRLEEVLNEPCFNQFW